MAIDAATQAKIDEGTQIFESLLQQVAAVIPQGTTAGFALNSASALLPLFVVTIENAIKAAELHQAATAGTKPPAPAAA